MAQHLHYHAGSAGSRADMQRHSPAGFLGRAANRHAADPDNLEFAFFEPPNLVRLLEPLQHYIQVCGSAATRLQDLFLDVAQPVLAEKDLVADKEGGRTKGAARD